ncbi:MAG TPA: malate synthase A, partial [Friedmanniella sp.]
GKRYAVGDQTPTIMVRPRGWHLDEDHLTLDGRPVPGSLVDFGLYFFHNAQTLIELGAGPYFYLPKLEGHLEARLWNDVFVFAQERLQIPYGTVRATCLVETTPAAFEMEEILYELRDHSSGLNAGRWDYIFSMIKNFADDAGHVLPDRSQVTMTSPFMAAYANLLVRTCHARGAHAIGGMAAFVPSRRHPEATAAALEKTTADKSREAGLGFDGSWVAHPALVQTCLDAFVAVLGDRPNQLERQRPDVSVTREDLVDVSTTGGEVTLDGLLTNIRISLEYLAAWVGGSGAVAIDNLMEDAATVEISRMQLWHWMRHRVRTADGTEVTQDLVRELLGRMADAQASDQSEAVRARLASARQIIEGTCLVDAWPQFFTGYAYEHFLVEQGLVEQGLVEQGLAGSTTDGIA